jgi:hypothetical protein
VKGKKDKTDKKVIRDGNKSNAAFKYLDSNEKFAPNLPLPKNTTQECVEH